jgi:pimeloyl-ACP methyl ester carboxylesterase
MSPISPVFSKFRWRCLLLVCLVFPGPVALSVQDVEKNSKHITDGEWYGVLDVQVTQLRLSMFFEVDEQGVLKGHGISLDQDRARMDFDSVTLKDKSVEFGSKRLMFQYRGELNAAGTEMVGTFTQGGRPFPLRLQKVDATPTRELVELWSGQLVAGPQKFDFVIRIFEEGPDKIRVAALDSLSEGMNGLTIKLTETGDEFDFDLKLTQARYEGTVANDRQRIEGEWIQAGQKFPLVFERRNLSDVISLKPRRPQTPVPPYPYRISELTIDVNAEVTISGTLTLPEGPGPFPVVVLVSGSGAQDRDETIFEHKPFAIWADTLTRRGIGVFRYDERGVGKSTGDFSQATSEHFASDVSAILDHLKTHANIDGKKMGIIGHSEGGLIAPMVAVSRDDLFAIVLLAGPAVTGAEIVKNQSRVIAKVGGAPTELIEQQQAELDRQFRSLAKPELENSPKKNEAKPSSLEKFMDNLGEQILGKKDEGAAAVFEQPWFKFFLQYDPRQSLEKLQTPVLAVFGELDLQVTPEQNVLPMREALHISGNKDWLIVQIPGLNHLFQKCETGLPTEYAAIEKTLDDSVLKTVSNWLVKRMLP